MNLKNRMPDPDGDAPVNSRPHPYRAADLDGCVMSASVDASLAGALDESLLDSVLPRRRALSSLPPNARRVPESGAKHAQNRGEMCAKRAEM